MKERRKGKSDYEHLEATNKKLRKENERLKKQLVRFEQKAARLDDIEPIYTELLQAQPLEPRHATCKKNNCGGPIVITTLPVGTLRMCQLCKDRSLEKK